MSLVTTTNWIVINANLVFLNCVLQVVYELKIADAIRAGAKTSEMQIFRIQLRKKVRDSYLILKRGAQRPNAPLHILYVRPKPCGAVPKNMAP